MGLFDSNPMTVKEQVNPLKYFGGAQFWDNYGEHSPHDSELWLKLMGWAHGISPDLSAALMLIRNTGAQLIPSEEFGYRIQPVIGPKGWASKEEYERERVWLAKYQSQVLAMLGRLAKEARS